MNCKITFILAAVFLSWGVVSAETSGTEAMQTSAPLTVTVAEITSGTESSVVETTSAQSEFPTRPTRLNYDEVGPEQDATARPLDEVMAVSSDTERLAWLSTASPSEDYRESSSVVYQTYKSLVAGDARDVTDGKKYVSTIETFAGNISRQPVGLLSGKVIFSSAGHGWTNDNTSTSLWYSQRPITHGVVEDFGNLDQMNLYADLCFRAGATIVPLRPLGFQHIERVIDNDSGQAAFYGEWADSESTASFQFAGADVPYRIAKASNSESAVARYQPVIPVTDTYPVYSWVRAGADRVNQTYRIVSAGGVTEVDVDHRRVGNGWVYLGSYLFKAGTSGYVEITNRVREREEAGPDGVVVADAVRFGNGMGDVNRGGGISRYPREEESSRYWVERSLASGYPPIYEAFSDREDQSNNVGTAPRFAAHMNRETDGGFFDRLFMSFHSNASGGRGVVGLYNTHAIMRPDHQIALAKLTADELNAQLTQEGITLSKPWFVRPTRTDGHINFGEIRRDYLNNEMSATIIEVAYHDDADDAELLKKLSIRQAVALSAYRATLRFFNEAGGESLPMFSPPDAPLLVSVKNSQTTGSVDLKWNGAAEDPLSSASGEIRYRLYKSGDGVVFDAGRDVGTVTELSVPGKEIQTQYYRITAVSAGGESLPSQVLGVSAADGDQKVLVVLGAATVNDDVALTQTEPAHLGRATGDGGEFVRLVPGIMNNGEQVRGIGDGIGRLKLGFDSISLFEFIAEPGLAENYDLVCLSMGREAVAADLATTDMLTFLHDYVTSGGRLLINSSCLAECDGGSTESLARWGEFARTVLQIQFAPVTAATGVIKSGDRDLTTATLQIGNRGLRYFEPRPVEVLTSEENGRPVLAYEKEAGIAAVATLKDRLIRTVVIGFPIEELANREEQGILIAQILKAMGLEAGVKTLAAMAEEPRVVIEDVEVALTDVETSKPL